MNKAFSAVFLLALLLPLAAGISTQTETVSGDASEVGKLISVDGSLALGSLLPGYTYASTISVKWAVPKESLSSIAEDKVIVYVIAKAKSSSSWAFFKTPSGGKTRVVSFQLTCIVANGDCTSGSTLSKELSVFYVAPQDAVYPHSDGVTVNAALEKIPDEDARVQEEQASKIRDAAQETLQKLPSIDASPAAKSLLQEKLADAKKLAEEGDLEAAGINLREASQQLTALSTTVPKSGLTGALTSLVPETNGLQLPIIAVVVIATLTAFFWHRHNKQNKQAQKRL